MAVVKLEIKPVQSRGRIPMFPTFLGMYDRRNKPSPDVNIVIEINAHVKIIVTMDLFSTPRILL